MEIRQLRYFIAVADTLSFSRAAESVYLSQSALSKQISDLEKEVGVPLLRRNTRQVELTEAGCVLRERAKELISRWEKLAPELHALTGGETALTLTIGTDDRALARPRRRKVLMESLYALRKKYPGARILLRSGGYQALVGGILDRSLDCALVLDRELEKRAGISQKVFGRERMTLVFRSANVHGPEDYGDIITSRGLILVDREPQGLYHIIRILSDLHLEPQIRFCPSLEDMTMTVETGESAAILPESVVAKLDNPNLQCLPLPSEYANLYFALLTPEKRENPMLDELEAGLKELF